jgi:hypothetical protein
MRDEIDDLPTSNPFPSLEGSPYGPNPQSMGFGDRGPPGHHRSRSPGNPGAQITKRFHPKEYETERNTLKDIRQRLMGGNFRAWDSQQKMEDKSQSYIDFVEDFPLDQQEGYLGDRSARFNDYSSPRVLDRLARSTGNYPVRGEAFRDIFRTDPRGTFNPERYNKQVEGYNPHMQSFVPGGLDTPEPYYPASMPQSDDPTKYYTSADDQGDPWDPMSWTGVKHFMGPPVPDDPPEASAEWREKMKTYGKPSGPWKNLAPVKPRYTPIPQSPPRRPFPYRP